MEHSGINFRSHFVKALLANKYVCQDFDVGVLGSISNQ